MKIGTIGYSSTSGLGIMLKFFRKHLAIDSQLVISWTAKKTNLQDLECKYVMTAKEKPSMDALEKFMKFEPDVVLIIEYPFCWDYLKRLKEKGIKIVYIPMLDSIGLNVLEKYKDFVDLWLCITKWSYELIKVKGWKCCYLPYPVDTDYFKFKKKRKGINFLHNAGYCGIVSRKGTDLVLKAFWELRNHGCNTSLIVNSQLPLGRLNFTEGVDIRVRDVEELYDLYKEGDIYLAPSRKEGLGLPIYEAMSCGFPVITTNAPPMNEVISDERLLVKTKNNEPDLDDLISKMVFVVNTYLGNISRQNRKIIEEKFSWNVLKSKYLKVFQEVVDGGEF
ncbi:MAG: glycosyltransferase family 4 protein [Candidatus Cloacimonetes bacterium]|nr:glycosyltransferase family 4 protein [Candidatus Cloacimonadota bacterium]